jgi:hypothetical protein
MNDDLGISYLINKKRLKAPCLIVDKEWAAIQSSYNHFQYNLRNKWKNMSSIQKNAISITLESKLNELLKEIDSSDTKRLNKD